MPTRGGLLRKALRQREDLLFRGGFLQGGDLLLQGVEPGKELGKPLEEACVGGVEADGDAAIEGVFLKSVGETQVFHGDTFSIRDFHLWQGMI